MSNPSTRGPPNRNSMEKASSTRAIHRSSDRATLPNGRGSERRGPSSERRSQGQSQGQGQGQGQGSQGGVDGSKVSVGYRSDVLLSLDRPPSSSVGDADSQRVGGGGGMIHKIYTLPTYPLCTPFILALHTHPLFTTIIHTFYTYPSFDILCQLIFSI